MDRLRFSQMYCYVLLKCKDVVHTSLSRYKDALYTSVLFLFGSILISCGGAGNEDLSNASLGLSLEAVSGDAQVVENPSEVSEEVVVRLIDADGSPASGMLVVFKLVNEDTGAVVLSPKVTTDSEGLASTKITSGSDFGANSEILVYVPGTGIKKTIWLKVRDKIVPDHFEFLKPAEMVAGGSVTLNIRLLGKSGRLVEEPEFDTQIGVAFSSPSNAAASPGFTPLPDSRVVDIKNGKGKITVSSQTAEEIIVTLVDTGALVELEELAQQKVDIGDSEVIKVVPDIPARILIADPQDGTTDAPVPVTVSLEDQYGNQTTNYSGPLKVDLNVTGNATVNSNPSSNTLSFVAGRSIAQVADTSVENVVLTLSNSTFGGLDISSTQDVNFAVGGAARVTLVDPIDGTVDNPILVTVNVEDQHGNFVNTFNGKVKLNTDTPTSSVDGGGLINIVAGQGSINVRDTKVETVNLTLADTQATGLDVTSTQDVFFATGVPAKFGFSESQYTTTADDPIAITVFAQDQFGNQVFSYSQDVRINTTGSATGAGTVNIAGGQGALNITDRTAETVILSLQDLGAGLDVSETSQIEVTNGAITRFLIVDPIDGTTDNPIEVTVRARDAWGNVGTNFQDDVTLVADGSATGAGLVDIVNGVGKLNISDTVAETVNLSLSDTQATGLDVTSTQDVVFDFGVAAKFVVKNPLDGTVDSAINVRVEMHDAGGNLVSDYSGSVSITVNKSAEMTSAPGSSVGVVNLTNGFGQRQISDQVAETVTIGLVDSAATFLDVSSTQDVIFAPGVVTQFTILDPTDGTVDAPIPVTVQAQDQYGNLNTTYGLDVTLNANGSAIGDGLVDIVSGVGTLNISNQVAETINLTLTDSQTTGNTVSSTQDVVFSPGAVTQYVIQNPTDGTVDAPIPVTVQAQDQYGNIGTSYNVDVTLVADGSATIAGGGVIDINNGVGQVNVSDTVAETVNLSLSDSSGTGNNVTSTQNVVFAPGVVTRFSIIDPTDGTVDNPIPVTVQAQDQYGNMNSSYNTDVTLNVDGSATVPGGGLVNISAGSGVINVSDTLAQTVNLTLTDSQTTGLNVSSTQDVVFGAGAVTEFIILDPTDGTVDAPISVTVQARDQYGNINLTYDDDVTLNTSGSATVANSGLVDVNNGIGIVNVSDTVSETVSLSLADSQGTGKDVSSTQDVIFASGVVTKFTIIDPTDGTVDAPISVKVEAQDQHGNKNPTYSGGVTLISSGSSTGDGLVTITSGQGLISISDQKAETVNLTLFDSQGTFLDVSSTQNVVFSPGVVTKFAIINPTDGTVDASIAVRVEAQDQYSNLNPTFFTDVSLLTDGSSTGGGVVDIASGFGTLNISDTVAETVNLTLSDSQATGLDVSSVQDVIFSAGVVTKFAIIDPTDGTVDAPIPVTIEARDQYNNKNSSYSGQVTLNTDGSATGAGLVTLASGSGILNISDTVTETVNLTLTDSQSTGLDVSSAQNVVFSAGAVTQYTIVDPTDGTVDNPIQVTVEARDQFGNRNFNYNIDVTLNASGSATGTGLVDIVNGSGNLNISNTVNETVNLTLTDSQATGLLVSSTQNVVFAPGAVTRFAIIDPTDGTVDSPIAVTLQAQDQYGNVNPTYQNDVTLVTDGSAIGAGLADIVNGTATLMISDTVVETVNLSLSDSASTGLNVSSTQNVVFSSGVVTQFVILNPVDTTVDNSMTVTVQAQDQYGNKNPTYQNDVTLVADGSATGVGLINIFNGEGSLNVFDQVAETVNFSLSDSQGTGLLVSSTQNGIFSPGVVTQFAIIDPTDGTVDNPIAVTVEARDQYGNMNPTFEDDVTLLAGGSATVASGGLVDISSGSGVLNVSDALAETVILSLSDSQGTGLTVTSNQSVVFSPGVVTRFVIVDPVDGTIDNPIPVTVQARDQYGNMNTFYNTDVFLETTGFATGEGPVDIINGQGVISISNTKAETVDLSLTDSQSTGLDVSSTQDVVFSPGVPQKITIINPADGTVDNSITVTVEVQDSGGNRTTAFDGGVTLNANGSATGAGLVTITNGVGTISLSDTLAETVNLTLTDSENTTLDTSSTQDVIFYPGVVTQFAILNPVDGTVDAPIAVRVQAQDQYGNKNFSYDDSVTLDTDGSATGGGTLIIENGEGFLNLSDQVAETVNLSLIDTFGTGLAVSSTQDVVFAPGVVTQFTILDPSDGTVDAPISVTVEARDQYGNMNPSYNTDVTLVADGSATVASGGLVDIVNGTGSLNVSDTVSETVNLTLTDSQVTGLDVSSAEDVIFSPGVVTQYIVLNPTDGTVDNPVSVTIQALDQYNNLNPTFNTDVTLVADGSATIAGGGVIDINNGVGQVNVSDTVAETVNLSLSDSQTTGLTVSSTQDVIFAPGVVTQFAILDPSDGTVDASISVTVQARDQYGNMNPSYQNDVTLVADGSAVVANSGLVDIVNGTGSLNVSDTVAETVNLSLSDSQTTGLTVSSTQDVIFSPGVVTEFFVLNPTDGTVDASISVTVQARDQYGNMNPTYQTDVTLLANGSATVANSGLVDIVNGTGSLNVSDTVAETVNLSLSDSQTTGLTVSSTQDVIFSPGVVTQFTIVDPTNGTTDNPVSVTVQARDQYGNVNPSYNTDVTLLADGSAVVANSGLVDISSGIGSINVSDTVAETVNLSLSDSQGTGLTVSSTQDVNFGAGVVTQFVVLNPTDGTVDAPITVAIRARDQYGNTNTTYQTDVTLVADGSAVVANSGLVDISNGIGSINVSDIVAETVNLTLSDSQSTGLDVSSAQDVNFGAGVVTQFVVLNPTDGTVDNPIAVTVEAHDQYGNMNPSYNTDVTLLADGSATVASSGLVDISNGIGSINVSDTVAETVNLSLSDSQGTGLTVSSTKDVIFAPGVATQFTISNPTDGTVDNPINVTVIARDQYGNANLGYQNDVTLEVDGSATGDGVVDIINGQGTLSISDQVAETVNLTLTDSQSTGLDVSSAENVVFAPGVVTQFTIVNPTNGTVDAPIAVTVRAKDQYGNINPTYQTDVTLVADGSAVVANSGLVDISNGVGSINVSDTVSETVNLSLSDSQATGLDVSSAEDVIFAAGVVTQFSIVNPVDGTTDNPISVTVQAKDQYGNVNINYSTDVTLVADGSAVVANSGLVDIVAGQGAINVSDTVAETVNLSLNDSQGTGKDVSSAQDVIFAVGIPNKFVMIDPTDGTVDNPITVTVEMQDAGGNRIPTYQTDVTLLTTGSATGGGLVDIVNGLGTIDISNTVAEIVGLSLTDSQSTGLDITSSQSVIFAAGVVNRFVIKDPIDGTIDNPIAVEVFAGDQYENLVSSYQNDVTLVTSGSATGGGLVNIINGTGTINISNTVAETVILTLSDSQGTGLNVSSTENVVFTHGVPVSIVIIDPTDGTTDNPIPVEVKVFDSGGNVVFSFNDDVTLVTDGSATGAGLVNISSGSGSINISDLVTETVNLSLSDTESTGLNVSSTQDVFFDVGVPAKFGILQPSAGTVDNPVTVTVQAQDAAGNKIPDYEDDVSMNTSGSATGGGLINITSGQGSIDISNTVAETIILSLNDSQGTGLNASDTKGLVFNPGLATQFVMLDPTDGTIDDPIEVTVEARDQYGNLQTNYQNDVTLLVSGDATVDNSGLINVVNGVGKIDVSDLTTETVALSLDDSQSTGLDVSSTQDVFFDIGAAVKFAIKDPVDGTTDNPITVTVEVHDQGGNIVTDYQQDVTLLTTGFAIGGGLVDIINGVGSLDISDTKAEVVNLSLTDSQSTGLNISSTENVVFGVGVPYRFTIINPIDGTVDNPIEVIVKAEDAGGNQIPSYQNDVTLNADGNATGAGLVDIVNGSGSLFLSDTMVQSVNLSLTDSQGTGLNVASVQNVAFNHGAPVRFEMEDPTDATTDDTVPVTIRVYDQYSNLATSFHSDVTLSGTGSVTGDGVVDISSGQGVANLNDTKAETVNLTLIDSQGTGLDVSSAQDVVFAVGAPYQFVIIDPANGTVLAPITVTVEMQDAGGNMIPGYNDDVTLMANGNATGAGLVDISGGSGTIDISDTKAETVTLSLVDSQATGKLVNSTENVVFGPGPANKFIIEDPDDGATDTPITVTIKAVDQYDNVVTSYANDVTLEATGSADGAGLVNISGGQGSLVISDSVEETVTFSLLDSQGTGLDVSSTQDAFFALGTPIKFVILDPMDGVVTSPVPVTVQVQDSAGTLIYTYEDDVTVNVDGSATGAGLVNIVNGVGVINISDQVAETVNLSLSDTQGTGLDVTSVENVKFDPGAVVKFVILNPVDGSITSPINVTVQAQDLFGNRNTSYGTDVTLNTNGAATGAGLVDIVGGEGSLNISNTVSETVTLTLSDTQGTGLNVTSTQDVYFAPGTPTKFAFIQPPDGTTDGPIFVTVEAQDLNGSKVQTFDGKVTVHTSGSATGGRELDIHSGKGVISIYDALPETVTLTLEDTNGEGLDVSDTIDITFAQGTVSKIVIEDPTDAQVRDSVTVTVKAVDASDDLVPSFGGTFQLIISGNGTGSGAVELTDGVGEITVSSDIAGTYTLSLTDPLSTGLDISSTQDVTFSAGDPYRIYRRCYDASPSVDESADCRFEIRDYDWNHVTTFNNSTDILANVDGGATIDAYKTGPSQKAINMVNGKGDFDVYNTHANVVNVTSIDNTGLGLVHSHDYATVVFQPGTPVKFEITDPTDTAVGESVAVTVEAKNASDFVVETYNGAVQLNVDGSATGGGLVIINNGVGTINISDAVSETVNLSLSDVLATGFDVSSTQDVFFSPAVATKFVIVDPTDGAWNQSVAVTIKAVTSTDVVDTSFNDDVTLVSDGSVTGAGLVDIVNGVGTINLSNTVAETVNLSLSDSQSTGLDVSSTQDLAFSNPVATKFVIIDPVDGSTDAPVSVTVKVLDADDALVTNYNTDVTLVTDGSATGAGLVDIVNGIGSLDISNAVAETVNLSLSDSQSTGLDVSSTQDAIFAVGTPTKFVIVDPTDGEQGDSISVTVEARNASDNIVTSYNGYVQMSSTGSGSVGGVVVISNGVGSTTVSNAIAETVTLSLVDFFATGFDVSSTQDLVFAVAAADHFEIEDPTDSSWSKPVTVTVKALTSNGFLDASYSQDVTLVSDGSATGAGLVDIVNGVGTLSISNTVAETVNLSLSDSQGTGLDVSSTQDLTFSNPVPVKFVIVDPTDGTTDDSITVTVRVLDADDIIVSNYNTDVTLVSDGSATGAGLVDIVNGVGTLSISNTVAETVNLSLSDSQSTGLDVSSTQDLVFSIGPPTKIVILDPTDGTTDGAVTVSLEAQTAGGALASNYSNVFGFTVTGGASGTITANAVVSISNGVGTITVDSTAPQTVNLGLTDVLATGLDVSSTQDLAFTVGAPAKIIFETEPVAESIVDTSFSTSAVIQLTDADDNVISSDSSSQVTASVFEGAGCTNAPAGTLGGTTTLTLASGEATFSDLSYDTDETISLQFEVSGYPAICSADSGVYQPLAINIAAQSINANSAVTLEVTGGVPPLSGFSLISNFSGASLSASGSCPANTTCIDYTAGPQGGDVTDVVRISDNLSNAVTSSQTVRGAVLAYTNPFADFDLGATAIDLSKTYTIKNNGSNPSQTGSLTVTLTPDDASMWSIVSVACDGGDLAYEQTCSVDVTFNAASGSGGLGDYSATLVISGATSGHKQVTIEAEKQ